MAIYLVSILRTSSSELPNLLLHQEGFTTSLRHRRTRWVADQIYLTSLFTFHQASLASIVSAALSLGFDLMLRRSVLRHIPAPEFRILCPVTVSNFLCRHILRTAGCSDFPLPEGSSHPIVLRPQEHSLNTKFCQCNLLFFSSLSIKTPGFCPDGF